MYKVLHWLQFLIYQCYLHHYNNYYNDLWNKVVSKNDSSLIDGNFIRKAAFLANGTPDGWQMIIGKTIIPFNWLSDYGILQSCEAGSFLYCINCTNNKTKLCLDIKESRLIGLNAEVNDIVVFFGIRIPRN